MKDMSWQCDSDNQKVVQIRVRNHYPTRH